VPSSVFCNLEIAQLILFIFHILLVPYFTFGALDTRTPPLTCVRAILRSLQSYANKDVQLEQPLKKRRQDSPYPGYGGP